MLNKGRSRWFDVLCLLLFNIYLVGMVEELKETRLGVNMERC